MVPFNLASLEILRKGYNDDICFRMNQVKIFFTMNITVFILLQNLT